jgi:hypothetical protein
MTIVKADSVAGFFNEVVEDAVRTRNVQTTEGAVTYIVSLLADFAKPGNPAEQTLDQPLAFLLNDAMNVQDLGDRFERLRTLGDGVLYTTGFFGDHFESRGVDHSYLIGIGQTAYKSAGSLIRTSSSRDLEAQANETDLFSELADKFAAFVAIIADVADTTVAKGVASSKGVLRLYERWLKTRSDRLADALSSQGFVTPRGTRVLS